ncbi:hypothetical protein EDB80DRAFT_842201 [Ilyonectria destructans]|nr:hypothetical protein EDB80DRAFT_842201 [Ilyonectria destructans]
MGVYDMILDHLCHQQQPAPRSGESRHDRRTFERSPPKAVLLSQGQGSADKGSFMLSEGRGRAAVFAPDGRQLTEPTDPNYDGLIYSDIELDAIDNAKVMTDCVGHYSRPDLLRLVVDDQPKNYVTRATPGSATYSPYHKPTGDGTLL